MTSTNLNEISMLDTLGLDVPEPHIAFAVGASMATSTISLDNLDDQRVIWCSGWNCGIGVYPPCARGQPVRRCVIEKTVSGRLDACITSNLLHPNFVISHKQSIDGPIDFNLRSLQTYVFPKAHLRVSGSGEVFEVCCCYSRRMPGIRTPLAGRRNKQVLIRQVIRCCALEYCQLTNWPAELFLTIRQMQVDIEM